MLGRDHALSGALAFAALGPSLHVTGSHLAAGVLLTAGAGTLPDIDHPDSTISREFGFLTQARAYLANVLDRIAAHIDAGTPFIFLEPSCASVFKDELLELMPNDPRAQRLRQQVWLLADWLAAQTPDLVTGRLTGANILIHGHCHHKAVFGGVANEISLLRRAGAAVEPIQAGCCGMAGPFGFEANKFVVSKTIASQGLVPAIESSASTTLIVTDGFSCREQIAQLTHRRALHFAEVLAPSCACDG